MFIPALLALLVLFVVARMLPKILFRILVVLILIPLVIGVFLVAHEMNEAKQRLFPTTQPAVQRKSEPLPIAHPQANPSHHRQR